MSTEPVEIKRRQKGGGLLLAGILMIGMGLSFAFDFMPAGLFISLGVGLIAMSLWRSKTNEF
jgi:hypothetical protein